MSTANWFCETHAASDCDGTGPGCVMRGTVTPALSTRTIAGVPLAPPIDWQTRCEKAEVDAAFVRSELATALKSLQEQEDACEKAERERDEVQRQFNVCAEKAKQALDQRDLVQAQLDAITKERDESSYNYGCAGERIVELEAELAAIKKLVANCQWCSVGESPNLPKINATIEELAAIKGRRKVWLIHFEDACMESEIFAGDEAEAAANKRLVYLSQNWACHLFVMDSAGPWEPTA